MTREEAWNMSSNMSIDIIDMIYDDIESRVCKNCKYTKPTEYDALYCSLIEISGCSFVEDDWYCKEFEYKLEPK